MTLLNFREITWSRRTTDLLVLRQALFDLFRCCKSLILLKVVGASGFEPPTSWSRTRSRNTILLARLVLFCVTHGGFGWYSAPNGLTSDSTRGLFCLNITFLVGRQLRAMETRQLCTACLRIGRCLNHEGHDRSQHMNFGSLNESIASLGGPMKKTLPRQSKAIKSPASANPYS